MPDIYQISENHRKALLSRDARAAREIIKAYQSVLKNLNGEFSSLHKQITEALLTGKPLRLSWLWERGDRLNALEQQILAEIARFSQTAAGIVSEAQTDLSEMGQSHANRLIESQVKGQTLRAGINVGTRLNRGAIESFVGFASDGSPLADLFNALGWGAAKKVREKLVAGIALGWGADRIAREMKGSFGGNLARALTVARTESLRAYRESSLNTYKDNSDVVEGWVWMSARNSRTCAMCWAMHGTIHPLEERLASHPNCRCFMLPLVEGVKRKIETGEEAFAKLPPAQQEEILGKAKFKAYKEGTISLSSLVGERNDPRWGKVRFERSFESIQPAKMKGKNSRRGNNEETLFERFSTINDAEKYFRQIGVNEVDFKGQKNIAETVSETFDQLRLRGLPLPSRVIVDRTTLSKGDVAGYSDTSDTLYINLNHAYWKNQGRDKEKIVGKAFRKNIISTNHPLHIIRHESGHWLQFRENPQKYNELFDMEMSQEVIDDLRDEMGIYGLSSPFELIAEMVAIILDGKTLSTKQKKWYDFFGGPTL